jgi:hypothetical protein
MPDFRFVFSCTVCRKVRDDQWDGTTDQEWCSFADFLRRYHACTEDVILSDCYCPDCALSYDRLVRYGQAQFDAFL